MISICTGFLSRTSLFPKLNSDLEDSSGEHPDSHSKHGSPGVGELSFLGEDGIKAGGLVGAHHSLTDLRRDGSLHQCALPTVILPSLHDRRQRGPSNDKAQKESLEGVAGKLHEEVSTHVGIEIEGSHDANGEGKLSDTSVNHLRKFCESSVTDNSIGEKVSHDDSFPVLGVGLGLQESEHRLHLCVTLGPWLGNSEAGPSRGS
mmetsp:Transcript_5397/g.8603  ORF Transcript_5397/g.8603 Transcript_5397/m.8603 type:complete len:204 (+) Transcript_5397:45-656(+)